MIEHTTKLLLASHCTGFAHHGFIRHVIQRKMTIYKLVQWAMIGLQAHVNHLILITLHFTGE